MTHENPQHMVRLLRLLPQPQHQELRNTLNENSGALHPSSHGFISCTLLHVSLDDPPAYTALSYTWGDPTKTTTILLDGIPFTVTINLESALRHFIKEDKFHVLWIDALCIDQQNPVEKGEQIELMRQIYMRAHSVISWLGPAANNSDIALKWIQKYGGWSFDLNIGMKPELQLNYLLRQHASAEGMEPGDLKDFIEDLSKQLSATNAEHTTLFSSISKLFKRGYWSRIWVVQELSSATNLLFQCGSEQMMDNALNHALRLLRGSRQYERLLWEQNSQVSELPTIPFKSSRMVPTTAPITMLKLRRAAALGLGLCPLIYLLRSFRTFDATDPRDKIFALLGIAADAEELGVHPNYLKSAKEVYTEIARQLIREGYLDVLSLVEYSPRVAGLPSWAHDWSMMSSHIPLQRRGLDRSGAPGKTLLEPIFSASGPSCDIEIKKRSPEDESVLLTLRAGFVGKIQEIGMTWERENFGQWFFDLQRMSGLISHAGVFAEPAEKVWRTAVADQEIRQGARKPRISKEHIDKIEEGLNNVDVKTIDSQKLIHAGLSEYREEMLVLVKGRRPIQVTGGYLGIGPCQAEVGDSVWILLGAQTPYVLRHCVENNTFRLVGEAYVNGIMDGEAMEDQSCIQTISLA